MKYCDGQSLELGDQVSFLEMKGTVVVLNGRSANPARYESDGWTTTPVEYVVIEIEGGSLVCLQNTEYNEHLSLTSRSSESDSI